MGNGAEVWVAPVLSFMVSSTLVPAGTLMFQVTDVPSIGLPKFSNVCVRSSLFTALRER
jgi:hypothetical protein